MSAHLFAAHLLFSSSIVFVFTYCSLDEYTHQRVTVPTYLGAEPNLQSNAAESG